MPPLPTKNIRMDWKRVSFIVASSVGRVNITLFTPCILYAMLLWPEQTQTSPNRTPVSVTVLFVVAVADVAVMVTPVKQMGWRGAWLPTSSQEENHK